MLGSFLIGAVAGAAIAIPVGAIAILIVDAGMRRGFRVAAAAGAGAATADGLYALLAVLGGTAAAAFLAPFDAQLRGAAVVALLVVAARGLATAARRGIGAPALVGEPLAGPLPTYLRFVGLTLLNPQTVVYFAALILGLPDVGRDAGERAAFVGGAFTASLAWQTVLAGLGALAHHRLPDRFRIALSVGGNVLIVGFALAIAGDLIAG